MAALQTACAHVVGARVKCASWIQLVGGEPASAEEKFRTYIREAALKYLAQPQFAFGPEQLPPAVESWPHTQLEHFREGLNSTGRVDEYGAGFQSLDSEKSTDQIPSPNHFHLKKS